MHWYIDVLKKYAVFNGRAQRAEYWFFALFTILIMVVLGIVDGLIGTFSQEAGLGLLSGLYCLAVFLPSLGVTIRRLHDTNRSGWWFLITLVPFIGGIWLLVLTLLGSTPGDNRFGPNPIQITA